VTDEPPVILFRDNNLLVVSKPSSIPMHPSGRYRHNSLLNILKYNEGLKNEPLPETLSIINRLDRLTSGICMIGLKEATAIRMHKLMEAGGWFRKEYVALVRGVFPSGNIFSEEPLRMIEHKLGLVVVDPDLGVSKRARTSFTRVATDGASWSLVRCWPETGRTHQIRVHLAEQGRTAIRGDTLYGKPPKDPKLRAIADAIGRQALHARELRRGPCEAPSGYGLHSIQSLHGQPHAGNRF
jgi:tRNA pseudouridine synthase 9